MLASHVYLLSGSDMWGFCFFVVVGFRCVDDAVGRAGAGATLSGSYVHCWAVDAEGNSRSSSSSSLGGFGGDCDLEADRDFEFLPDFVEGWRFRFFDTTSSSESSGTMKSSMSIPI